MYQTTSSDIITCKVGIVTNYHIKFSLDEVSLKQLFSWSYDDIAISWSSANWMQIFVDILVFDFQYHKGTLAVNYCVLEKNVLKENQFLCDVTIELVEANDEISSIYHFEPRINVVSFCLRALYVLQKADVDHKL